MQMPDLRSNAVKQAFALIQKRAEKITGWQRLSDIFVPSDVRTRVESPDTQLVLGRRGTGKTHLIRAFQEDSQRRGQTVIYCDCTQLGSGYSGLNISPSAVASKYFTALLNQLGSDLHTMSMNLELPDAVRQHDVMKQLVDAYVPLMSSQVTRSDASLYNYAQIARTLQHILSTLDIERIYLILDEWAQIPFAAQPHFAEFLKRALSIVPPISLKLLAVNYQCQFSEARDGNIVGLQRGADIPDVVDLDQYLILAQQGEVVIEFFGQVLYNHLGIELGWELQRPAADKVRTIEKLFTQKDTFVELVRAAEGNARDFLCIVSKAYFDEFCTSSASNAISKPNITKAATLWFDCEKLANIKAERDIVDTLAYIMDNVLKRYKSRTFMVEATQAEHLRLVRLLNERVLHKLSGTYSTKDRPGVRYELFTVDYGAFIRFRGTARQVVEDVFISSLDANNDIPLVPVDDKRSIRRIIFDPTELAIEDYGRRRPPQDCDLPLWRTNAAS